MKIGLIGNMNNNNFAIMRYFRDLGADAHLLLYENDGKGGLSHFKPECDTWEIDKWLPYIHQTIIQNRPIVAIDSIVSFIWSCRSLLMTWRGKNFYWQRAVSNRKLVETYLAYDKLVASGVTPATLVRIGRSLDIFYPYSTGVEFIGAGDSIGRSGGVLCINSLISQYVARQQAKGLRSAKVVLNAELGLTGDVLRSIGVKPVNLPVPMIYDREILPESPPTKFLQEVSSVISKMDFTILHQARLMWVNPGSYSSSDWRKESKNNNLLLHSFAELRRARPSLKTTLFILEYGPDVASTKQLATELGLESCIYWCPKMDRRELMWLLTRVSIGVGEFYDFPRVIWGGSGWECLASGKPLLQGFNFHEGEFENLYGIPPPPMLHVRDPKDILNHLLDMADHPEKREKIGCGGKEWFKLYNGISLARKWLDLLMAPPGGDTLKAVARPGAQC